MTSIAPWTELLQRAPRPERRRLLTQQVSQTFKQWLHMDEADLLALDESYFAQGLSSLGAVEIQQHLETMLGCRIDSASLYNHPTITHLIDHVCRDLLPALFPPGTPVPSPPEGGAPARQDGAPSRQLLDALLDDLYDT